VSAAAKHLLRNVTHNTTVGRQADRHLRSLGEVPECHALNRLHKEACAHPGADAIRCTRASIMRRDAGRGGDSNEVWKRCLREVAPPAIPSRQSPRQLAQIWMSVRAKTSLMHFVPMGCQRACAFNHRHQRAAHDLSLSLLACNAHRMFREEISGPAQGPPAKRLSKSRVIGVSSTFRGADPVKKPS